MKSLDINDDTLSAHQVSELNKIFKDDLGERMAKILKYFKLAKEINDKNKELFITNEAHCRGSINSISLISLNKNRPELGFSGLKTDKTIDVKLKELKNKKLGRATPEKVLQSWIIKNAIKNNYILPFGDKIKFITSEMAVYDENKKRIVNDILGFKDGSLYVIELKSDRAMSRLIEQVYSFKDIIKKNINLFDDLCKLYDHTWNRESIIKVIVWPFNKNGLKSSEELDKLNIIEYGYEKIDDNFKFTKYEKN